LSAAGLAGALLTAILAAIAVIHALWGLGSSFPAADRDALALLAIGRRQVPPPLACFVVAAGVAAMAALPSVVLGWVALPQPAVTLARLGCWAAAAIFAARGVAGYLPAFERIFPLEPFHTMNRVAYSPLCLAVAALFVVVARAR
jgi:Protein of unknown function (DUF3995)